LMNADVRAEIVLALHKRQDVIVVECRPAVLIDRGTAIPLRIGTELTAVSDRAPCLRHPAGEDVDTRHRRGVGPGDVGGVANVVIASSFVAPTIIDGGKESYRSVEARRIHFCVMANRKPG